jgi:hypothetical protein
MIRTFWVETGLDDKKGGLVGERKPGIRKFIFYTFIFSSVESGPTCLCKRYLILDEHGHASSGKLSREIRRGLKRTEKASRVEQLKTGDRMTARSRGAKAAVALIRRFNNSRAMDRS